MLKLRMAAVTATAAAALATTALAAAPASAATVHPNAGWLGNCYPVRSTNYGGYAGGWCDGNGPDWRYQGVVYCSNGYYYVGVVHWAGDRRGSYAYCPSGSYPQAGGLDIYYDSTYEWSDYV